MPAEHMYIAPVQRFNLILRLCLLLMSLPVFGQSDTFRFKTDIRQGNYYLLHGTILGKHPITMKLTIDPAVRCGVEGTAVQWKNGGIDGWYQYDRIGKKIELIGSFQYDREVTLFVPGTPGDTIDLTTCQMENYKEIFWNEQDFDVTRMQWKMSGDQEAKSVELNILHEPAPDTLLLIFERGNIESRVINISKLIDLQGMENIKVLSYAKADENYHVLFKLENIGRREYQVYVGHLSINANLALVAFDVFLSYDSWKGEKEPLIYDVQHPERGIQKQEPSTILDSNFEPDTANTVHLEVNAKDEIRLENRIIRESEVCQKLQPFLLEGKRVYLANERNTNFKRYLDVYKAVRACVQQLRAQKARQLFGKEIDQLTINERKAIDKILPLQIIEDAPK